MQALLAKAKPIRLLALDADGVMTTGALYYGDNQFEMKGFHVLDGVGIKLLQKSGITIAVISGRQSEALARRCQELAITHCYFGNDDKLHTYDNLKQTLGLKDTEIAYMGDDLPDLPLLRRAGLAITVPNAPLIIQQHVDIITKIKAGKGAVREIADWLIEAQGNMQTVIQSYLTD